MKKSRAKSIKRILRVVRRPFEWLGIGLALVVFAFLSRQGMLRIADFISAVMWFFDRGGRNLAYSNLKIMYASSPVIQHNESSLHTRFNLIIRRSYRNMSRSVAYAFWTCRKARTRAAESGFTDELVTQFLAENHSAVTVSGHLGCWEILSQLALLNGHQMVSVAKDIGSSGMTQLLMRARRSIGQEIVRAEGAFRPLMAALKAGKSLGLLVDQVVKPKNGGVWVRFFGRPVPVSAAPAFFAAKGKAPIIVAWSRPLKSGKWCCSFISSYSFNDARDVWATTQHCLNDLERIIRRHPSAWVLDYRYFRRVPSEAELAQLNEREAKFV